VVEVQLSQHGDKLRLIVQDNGHGFDPRKVAEQGSGLGMRNIHARAQLLGGSVQVESQPGEGAAALVTIPLPGAQK